MLWLTSKDVYVGSCLEIYSVVTCIQYLQSGAYGGAFCQNLLILFYTLTVGHIQKEIRILFQELNSNLHDQAANKYSDINKNKRSIIYSP